jgi:hypothetical protein
VHTQLSGLLLRHLFDLASTNDRPVVETGEGPTAEGPRTLISDPISLKMSAGTVIPPTVKVGLPTTLSFWFYRTGKAGLIFYKGKGSMASQEEVALPYSFLSLSVTPSSRLEFKTKKAGADTLTIQGRHSIPLELWTHIAIVFSSEKISLLVQGELDGSKELNW